MTLLKLLSAYIIILILVGISVAEEQPPEWKCGPQIEKQAEAFFGVKQGATVSNGFLLVNGQYIEAPYKLARRGLTVFANDAMLEDRLGKWVIYVGADIPDGDSRLTNGRPRVPLSHKMPQELIAGLDAAMASFERRLQRGSACLIWHNGTEISCRPDKFRRIVDVLMSDSPSDSKLNQLTTLGIGKGSRKKQTLRMIENFQPSSQLNERLRSLQKSETTATDAEAVRRLREQLQKTKEARRRIDFLSYTLLPPSVGVELPDGTFRQITPAGTIRLANATSLTFGKEPEQVSVEVDSILRVTDKPPGFTVERHGRIVKRIELTEDNSVELPTKCTVLPFAPRPPVALPQRKFEAPAGSKVTIGSEYLFGINIRGENDTVSTRFVGIGGKILDYEIVRFEKRLDRIAPGDSPERSNSALFLKDDNGTFRLELRAESHE